MAESLSKDHEVAVITGRSRNKPLLNRIKNASFNVITVPFWPRSSFKNNFVSKIYKRMYSWKVESYSLYWGVLLRSKVKNVIRESDVIVTYYRSDSKLFSNLAKKYGVPCVSNFQLAGFGKKFFAADKSVMYLANSKFSKQALEKKNNIKIEGVITPGVSSDFFNERIPKIPEMTTSKSILFVGNLRKQKGIFELIDIFKEVSKNKNDMKLYILGSGEMRDLLIERIRSNNLTDKVILKGEVPFEKMPSYYRSATMLVHPSHEETFGMVILEAMASQVPVIATDLPAIRELGGDAVILLPLKDKTKWVEKIEYLLKNPEIGQRMGESGKKMAKEHLWENKAKQLEVFLLKASEQKGKL
jgi:glycosyltransferase involved in cell wall biosynthesis